MSIKRSKNTEVDVTSISHYKNNSDWSNTPPIKVQMKILCLLSFLMLFVCSVMSQSGSQLPGLPKKSPEELQRSSCVGACEGQLHSCLSKCVISGEKLVTASVKDRLLSEDCRIICFTRGKKCRSICYQNYKQKLLRTPKSRSFQIQGQPKHPQILNSPESKITSRKLEYKQLLQSSKKIRHIQQH
jgi:hypothetical protein